MRVLHTILTILTFIRYYTINIYKLQIYSAVHQKKHIIYFSRHFFMCAIGKRNKIARDNMLLWDSGSSQSLGRGRRNDEHFTHCVSIQLPLIQTWAFIRSININCIFGNLWFWDNYDFGNCSDSRLSSEETTNRISIDANEEQRRQRIEHDCQILIWHVLSVVMADTKWNQKHETEVPKWFLENDFAFI